MELQEAILKRRSIRKFTDYFVTDDEIKELIDAARLAPSWANTQAWTFIVVRDKSVIERIAATYSETNPARKCSLAASAVIAACAKKGISGCKGGVDRTKFNNWFMFDLGMAVENLCLRAHELGIGTVVVGLLNHDECRKILYVPDDYELVAIIPVGRPGADKGSRPIDRKDLKDITHLNKFGEPFIK